MKADQLPFLTIFLVLLIDVGVSNNLNWGGNRWQFTLDADAKGYFAYLPAVFVYGDPNLGFFPEMEQDKYHIESQFYDYRVNINEAYTNKYFGGTALMVAPFYLLAHSYVLLNGGEEDGYSFPYVLSVMLAALFYLVLGLLFLNKFLSSYGISAFNRSLVLLAAAFGTHLFNYSVVEPGFSHVYSFSLFCAFLVAAQSWIKRKKASSFVLMCFVLGLITFVRPSNLLIVLSLPFLAGGMSALWTGIVLTFRQPIKLMLGAALFALAVSLQLLYNFWATGQVFIDTYAGEGFHFTDPHFLDVLFSYKKGLFLYTPMCLLALLGIFSLLKKNWASGMHWLLFMGISIFVVSSWHNWWYGGSFSMRPFVEYLPFFLLPLGLALQSAKVKWQRVALITALFAFLVINQIQTYQYRYYHIHYEDMTKEKYWDVFLRVDKLP